MAHQTVTVGISVTVKTPEFAVYGIDEWNEHYHGEVGKQARDEIVAAITEQVSNALPTVMVNGEELEVVINGLNVREFNVILDAEEQEQFNHECAEQDAGWDAFHEELHRRMERDGIENGCYSMGDLYGPISQLDEVVHKGKARVVISDGWGDANPVISISTITNPTNWDMFKMFTEALEKSNDKHHVFLEGIEEQYEEDDVTIFKALTGS